MLDFLLLELYIKKKYDQSVERYFNIGPMSVSAWRKSNTIPPKRLIEFLQKEGTIDPKELFSKIY